eukprot:902012-Pelagomonas_calceolata.AAC.10
MQKKCAVEIACRSNMDVRIRPGWAFQARMCESTRECAGWTWACGNETKGHVVGTACRSNMDVQIRHGQSICGKNVQSKYGACEADMACTLKGSSCVRILNKILNKHTLAAASSQQRPTTVQIYVKFSAQRTRASSAQFQVHYAMLHT